MPQNLSHPGSDGPATRFAPVQPNDAVDLPGGRVRALFVGIGGALRIRGADGVEVTLMSADSQYHPVRVARVLAAGTTAGDIVALY